MGLEKIRNLRLKIVVAFFSVSLVATFFSCDRKDTYFRYNELKEGKWKMHDTLSFVIDSTAYELGIPYDLYLEVTNNVNYPYQNIWFFEWDNIANDSVFVRSSHECNLADEFGRWQGKGFGSLYQSTFFLNRVVFEQRRNVTVKILHGMQDEELHGIEKVGVRLGHRN